MKPRYLPYCIQMALRHPDKMALSPSAFRFFSEVSR